MEKKYIIAGAGLVTILSLAYFSEKKKKVTGSKLDAVSKRILATFAVNNKQKFDSLNPEVKKRFKDFENDITNMGYAVIYTSAYRPTSKQIALKKENPKNATAGYSTHEYGIGIDINLVKDGKWINKDSPKSDWLKTGIVDLAKNKYKFNWGGDFGNYYDPVHFADSRYNTTALYARALKQFGSADKIQGNKMKLAA